MLNVPRLNAARMTRSDGDAVGQEFTHRVLRTMLMSKIVEKI